LSDELDDSRPNVNPFQVELNPPTGSAMGHPDPGPPAPQQASNQEDALRPMPLGPTFRDLAVAHLRKMEAQAEPTGSPSWADSTGIRQSMGERASDPAFNRYDSALRSLEGRNEFSHEGQSYFKSGGNTYLRHDDLSGGMAQLHPDAAARLDAARIEDAGRDYDRQEYLRRREEWHDTPDTPNAGWEFGHSPRAHDPDNTPEREERIVGKAVWMANAVPSAASYATGAYELSGGLLAKFAKSSAINTAINKGANSGLFGTHPFSDLQPHIDN